MPAAFNREVIKGVSSGSPSEKEPDEGELSGEEVSGGELYVDEEELIATTSCEASELGDPEPT